MERHSPILQLIALLFLLHHLLSHNLASTTIDLKPDKSSLLAFKSRITDDSFDTTLGKNWTTKTSVCNWIGVTCGSHHRRVIALEISYMSLEGTIPPHIGNLSFLVYLNITGNHFHGDLPKELVHLSQLRVVDFSNNGFAGDLPKELAHLHRLRVVDFSSNNFAGELPRTWFGNMTDLEELHLNLNGFSGMITLSLGYRYFYGLIALTCMT
ncbi:Non-specific serine/threonine protein kinase [Handroanthus impetiginosus]|uniref:Non-specific serine/threonine protein kinase n=1 Tax=Handroanthus impetiginosus TaxID=429701 RepID=A0A2G9HIC4_9LAMI|nr:Non-specific serine/threonine protein kinase [Handroanthus impetiginosus]